LLSVIFRAVLEILPSATFSSILKPYLPATAATALSPNFVLKYSAFITSRGLITKKGYVFLSLFVVRKRFILGWHHFAQLFSVFDWSTASLGSEHK